MIIIGCHYHYLVHSVTVVAKMDMVAIIGKSASITANLRTKTLDFREFDSSGILILRGGIPRPMGSFPESLSQAILVLVGMILVGRLGVSYSKPSSASC